MSNLLNLTNNLELKTKKSKPQDIKERAFEFSIDIIKLASEFPNKKTYWIISNQLIRSATSIGANIIEAQGSSSKKEFINFYHIALKSSKETVYWLRLLKESGLVSKDKVSKFIIECTEISKILTASILTMKRSLQ
ncbi:MAG: four helix bundle protein [Patescibacteria group bacterium]